MPQSLAKLLVHLVYSTKHRERILTEDIREELHRYTAGILKNYDSPAIYIENQKEHHKRQSFQDEFRLFLKRHEIEFDERYVWD